MYNLIWNNEVVDAFETEAEARTMQTEYNMAYGGGVVVEWEDEDDGQPTMYEEYQDLYGGDDAFETCNFMEDY